MTLHRLAIALTLSVPVLSLVSVAEAHPRRRAHTHATVVVYPQGLYVGAGLVATRILHQDGGPELLTDGVGLSLYGGLRANERLAVELGWTGTFHNPEDVETVYGSDVDFLALNALTADAKVFFPDGASGLEPYVQGGVGAYLLDSTYFGTQSAGTGFQLGGGFGYQLGNAWLGGRALFRGIAMGPPDRYDSDTFVSAVSVEGNLTLQF